MMTCEFKQKNTTLINELHLQVFSYNKSINLMTKKPVYRLITEDDIIEGTFLIVTKKQSKLSVMQNDNNTLC